ncbi:MAG: family 10 glycosylhydrolase [Clostridia bacterium]|nr:family 10 glycosylhydrolase [Clostridia bacterium]
MRKHLLLSVLFLTLLTLLSSCIRTDYDTTNPPLEPDFGTKTLTHILHPDAEVRGVWIASVFNIDYPSRTDLSADELRAQIDAILDTCEQNRLNTVFFQVRPSCDALYDSELFPVSSFLSSSGTLVFDPLDYIVTEGHKRNIRIHAWVNPLRVTVSGADLSALPASSPARKNPDWVVPYADGKLYFNAGLPEVHNLIADGVAEIVSKYDVDGVVFDDYFYPYPAADESGKTAVFDDDEAFARYGSGFDSREDWRRENINTIVKLVYDTVHAIDDACQFGISPFAIWQNDDGTNGGSATNGFEGYNSLYCDALAWIEGGYIDYISPQIYWTFDNKSASFDVLTRWWNAAVDGTDVKLYVSHASYRYEEGEWDNPAGQLTEQVTFARAEKAYRGSVFFGYDEIRRNIRGASDDVLAAYTNDIIYMDIVSNGLGIQIAAPTDQSSTSDEYTYIIGMCDPYYPLTVTGGGLTDTKVSMTKSGYFSLYVPLEKGENLFVFEQNGKETRLTVHRTASLLEKPPAEEGEQPVLDSLSLNVTYPLSDITTDEDILWVQCTAPYGSKVKVSIGGVESDLVPLEKPQKTWVPNGYPAVVYGVNAVLPSAADGEILDCGTAHFTLTHADGTVKTDGSRVRVLGEGAFLCVRAKEDYTHLKITPSSSYYNDYTVQSAGMTDYAVSQQGGYYRLRMGGYVSEDAVEEITDPALFPSENGTISASSVYSSGKETVFRVTCADRPPYNGAVEDGRFVVTFYGLDAETAPMPSMGDNPLLTSCEIIRLKDRVRYSFALTAEENFYGFDLRYDEKGVLVTLRNPVSLDLTAEKPLQGISIVLDAGHGGYDRGASGALVSESGTMHEKDLNLAITLEAGERLSALGADVILTRSYDSTFDLLARAAFLEETEPDLCISVHQNSMGLTSDITRIRGTLGLYCMDSGRMLADAVGGAAAASLGRNWRGAAYQMLAMCRNPKFPQALIEVGFITSVEEYEYMTAGEGIHRAAEGICDGVLSYYARQSAYAGF